MMSYKVKNNLYILANMIIVLYGFTLFINWKDARFLEGVLFVLWLITGDFKEKFKKIFENKLTISFLLFLLLFIVGLIWTEDIKAGIHIIKYPMLYLIVPMVVSMYRNDFLKWYKVAIFGALLYTGILTLLIDYNMINMMYTSDESPFINRVYLGIMLVFAYSYFVSHISFEKKILTLKNTILLFSALLMVYTIVVSGSRMAFINIILASAIIFFYKYKFSIKTFLMIFVSAIILIFVAYNQNASIESKINQTMRSIKIFDFTEQIINKNHTLRTSLTCRFEFWYYAYKIGNKYPILGAGTGDGILELERYMGKKEFDLLFKSCLGKGTGQFNPHNLFIFMYMQFGILGFILLLYILYIQMKVAIESKSLAFIILVTVTVTSMFSLSLLFTSKFFIPFYGFSTIVMYLSAKERR